MIGAFATGALASGSVTIDFNVHGVECTGGILGQNEVNLPGDKTLGRYLECMDEITGRAKVYGMAVPAAAVFGGVLAVGCGVPGFLRRREDDLPPAASP